MFFSILVLTSSNVFASKISPTLPICFTDVNGKVEQILDRSECVSKRIEIKSDIYLHSSDQVISDPEQFRNLLMLSDPRNHLEDKHAINFNIYLHAVNVFNSSDLKVKDFKLNKDKSFRYTYVFVNYFYRCEIVDEDLRSIYDDSVWLNSNESNDSAFMKIFNRFIQSCDVL